MKKILKEKENQIVLGVMILCMAVALCPLVSRYCIQGHDIEYHMLRIEALKENILTGRPFLKVDPLFFGGAGYASSLFYSDFLLYIPALMRAAGFSIGASYHTFVAVCAILCMLSAYYCVSKMTGSKYAGLIAGIILTLCPYHMDDLLVRAAAGEYMAFIFVPFAVYGIFNVFYEKMDKPWILAIGFAGVILSHTATTVMCVIFAVIAVIVKIKVLIKDPSIVIRLILTAAVTAMVTSIYWLPVLEQFMCGRFGISSGGGVDMLDAAVDLSQVFSQQFPTVGICLLLPVVLRLFITSKDNDVLKFADWLLVGGALFSVLSLKIMPWEYLSKLLSFVQFPWRFFLMASVLFSMADAIIIKEYAEQFIRSSDSKENNEIPGTGNAFRVRTLAIAVVFAAAAFTSMDHYQDNKQEYYDYSNDYYSYKPYTCSVIGGEWLPEGVTDTDDILTDSEKMTADDGTNLEFSRIKGNVTADITKSCEYIDVPFIYYKGYSAVITANDGSKTALKVDGQGKNGFCRVYTAGCTGTLKVGYSGTFVQKLSYIVTAIGWICVIFYFYKKKRKAQK